MAGNAYQLDGNTVLDTRDRNWWWILRFTNKQGAGDIVKHLFCEGVITEYQLWDLLGTSNGPISYGRAAQIYKDLGFSPHAGYPLTRI